MGIGALLEALLRSLSPSAMTDLFVVIMLGVFIFAIHFARTGRHPAFYEHAPSLLTSLGILGTFLGIILGLLDFNANEIQKSIPTLLEGLKTAFLTSLVGMVLAVIFKGVDTFYFTDKRGTQEAPPEVTPIHIYAKLNSQLEVLRSLEKAVAGAEEGTLVGQMKLLRSDVSDFRSVIARNHSDFEKKLFEQMQNFAEMLSKSATETVIEALRQVIVDFNRHLVEQFGDNFKALDQSVKEMVEWQAKYKSHVEAMEARIEVAISALERMSEANERIAGAMEVSEKAVAGIREECAAIPGSMNELSGVLRVNHHQIEELGRHLESFVMMRAQAVDAVPKLQEQLERLTDGIRTSLDKVLQEMISGATEFGAHSDRVNTALGETANVISNSSEKIATDLKDAASGFNSSARETLKVMQEGTGQIEKGLQEAINRASVAVSKAVEQSISEMERSVNKVAEQTLRSMATTVETTVNQVSNQVQGASTKTLASVEGAVEKASKELNGSINGQLATFQKGLERELELVFQNLGSGLATISRRLADDHARLSKQLNG